MSKWTHVGTNALENWNTNNMNKFKEVKLQMKLSRMKPNKPKRKKDDSLEDNEE